MSSFNGSTAGAGSEAAAVVVAVVAASFPFSAGATAAAATGLSGVIGSSGMASGKLEFGNGETEDCAGSSVVVVVVLVVATVAAVREPSFGEGR